MTAAQFDLFTKPRVCKFSPCRQWRYTLLDVWDEELPVQPFIGLNPSYADESRGDHTVNKCIEWSKRWGAGGFMMLNLFGWRDTYPEGMKAAADPVGPENTPEHLMDYITAQPHLTPVCAWGNHGTHRDQDLKAFDVFSQSGLTFMCFGLNLDQRTPRHPLMLGYDTELKVFIEG